MSYLVGNPEDLFSRIAAKKVMKIMICKFHPGGSRTISLPVSDLMHMVVLCIKQQNKDTNNILLLKCVQIQIV